MRLLEVFLLMERTDRLNYLAQNLQKKILARWTRHIEEAGIAGLPHAWKDAYYNELLPDPSWRDTEKDNWTEKLTKSGTEWVVEWFSQHDPTPNKKYTDWMIRQWINDKALLEDVSKFRSMLETFEAHKNNLKKMDIPSGEEDYRYDQSDAPIPPPERRGDLNSWKDYRVLARVLRPLTGVQAAGEKVSNFLKKPEIQDYMNHPVPDPVKAFGRDGDFDFDDLQSNYVDENGDNNFDTMDWYGGFNNPDDVATNAIEPIYKSDRLAILQPNTRAAACELGKGTEWCTSSTEAQNYFWDYATDGPLYVILTDKMGKFQFHFESNQFMDVHDDPISKDVQKQLVDNYPELKEIFAKQAIHPLHGEDWLVDPSVWTLDKIKEFISSGDKTDITTLAQKIKPWEDELPEEVLQYLEALARKHTPTSAYGYVRNPTEEDYEHSILANAEEGTNETRHVVANIVGHAISRGIQLDDDVIEAAVGANAQSILHVPAERLQQNPDWVIKALLNNTQRAQIVMEAALERATQHPTEWSNKDIRMGQDEAKAIMNVIHTHPQGQEVIDRFSYPSMVVQFLDYFGTEPWMKAYQEAERHASSDSLMMPMAKAISMTPMKNFDYTAFMSFLIQNDIMHMQTFLAVENAMGELPIGIQNALLDNSPARFSHLKNPNPQLAQTAHGAMDVGPREFAAARKQHWENNPKLKDVEKDAWLDRSTGITEGVSPILYHVSQISNIRDMLTDNAIRLTPDFGTRAEQEHQPEGKIYYLSTARSKTGGYGYPVSQHQKQGAMVVFDGQALMADGYTGKAVDYWGPEFRKLGKDEMEDRIFSKKPTIPKASKYIKEIHILFNSDNENAARTLKDLGYKAKRLNVPLYIYTDSEAFGLLNKAKAASVATVDSTADRLPLPGTDVEPRGYRSGPAKNYFGGWMELLNVNDENQLSKLGQETLYKAHYSDASRGLDADIHNARTNNQRPHLDKFLAALQQYGIKSTQELMDYVNQKFK